MMPHQDDEEKVLKSGYLQTMAIDVDGATGADRQAVAKLPHTVLLRLGEKPTVVRRPALRFYQD